MKNNATPQFDVHHHACFGARQGHGCERDGLEPGRAVPARCPHRPCSGCVGSACWLAGVAQVSWGSSARIKRQVGAVDRDGLRGAKRSNRRAIASICLRSRPPEAADAHGALIRAEGSQGPGEGIAAVHGRCGAQAGHPRRGVRPKSDPGGSRSIQADQRVNCRNNRRAAAASVVPL